MTEHEMKCPECGGRLEVGKPCPNCLLKMAMQPTDQLDAGLNDLSIPADTTNLSPSDRLKNPEPDIEAVRTAFPQLEIIDMIGHGGMGTVFRARQPKLDRFVALKILSAKLAEKPTFAERFAQEGKLLARLSHPNIVTVYDYGEANGFYYLILEYVDGVNLRQAMHEERFSSEQALAIVPKICEALQYAHDEGVLHRDIKPENILLDTKGRIKIADFGIGKLVQTINQSRDSHGAVLLATELVPCSENELQQTDLTQQGLVLGTPSYMAPEQRETPGSVDHRADIYSLGVVFYELLTGELPKGDFPIPSEKTPVSAEVDEIVQKALQRERDKRYQSAEEMKTHIETVTPIISKSSSDNPPPKRSSLPTHWGALPLWARILLLVFLIYTVSPSLIMLILYVIDMCLGDDGVSNDNFTIGDLIYTTVPILIFFTIAWLISKHTGKQPVSEIPSQQEPTISKKRISKWPIVFIGMIGLSIPYLAFELGVRYYGEEHWKFIKSLEIESVLFLLIFQLVSILPAIGLYCASLSYGKLLKYLTVICNYGVYAGFIFDLASVHDPQAGIGFAVFPFYGMFAGIGGYFLATIIHYFVGNKK